MAEVTLQGCIDELRAILGSGDKYDRELIDKALDLACHAHAGQFRRSGEEYVCHPISVAKIVVELGMDTQSVCAALLHDVVEDTTVELPQIKRDFGEDVALIVDGVTKLKKLDFATHEQEQAENVRKMLLAMSKDIRVIIIKLADRLHNMRTIEAQTPAKKLEKARETMEIYAPLAHRLGMRGVKEELEDLSLRTLDPVGYADIEQSLALHADERMAFLTLIQERLKSHLEQYNIKCALTGRVKSIAGIYRKMYMQGHSIDEIYDIYAVRVIVDTVGDCYNVLGVVHEMFHMLPNRFKDYISNPKSNMYQSLHTTVIDKEKIPFEVQIRTWDMHYTAEYGIAAHWKYKLGMKGGTSDKLEDRLNWVRQLLENPTEDAEDLLSSIKTDLSTDDVFVFSPKGDITILPVGATPVDFAYAIHSAVGNRMIGAKVDGRIVPLNYTLKMGQIVEIITSSPDSAKGPSRDWLNIVKTSEARNKIRAWFKKERREENIEQGRLELEREFSRSYIRLADEKMDEFLLNEAKKQHFASVDDFVAAIGYGGIQLSKIMPHIKEDYLRLTRETRPPETVEEIVSQQAKPAKSHSHNGGIVVEGMDNCLVKFARCCNPLPGDDVIGFITRGYGVSVHKRDCSNVPADIEGSPEAARWVRVHWEDSVHAEFKATLYITAKDRRALLADVSMQLAAMHVTIHSINAPEPKDDRAQIILTVGVNNLEHLQLVIDRLKRVPDVLSVVRNKEK